MSRSLAEWLPAWMEYMSNNEAPSLYKKWVGVSLIASCLQRKCFIMWEKTLYPNFYIVLVGTPAARKGTAMGPALSFLRRLGVRLSAEAITKEALALRMSEANVFDIPPGGTAPEEHCSMTIFSEELTVFIGYNNPQFLADLCNWYDCSDIWTYDTKGKGTTIIKGVWVNMIGATTPALFRTTLPSEAIGGGLVSRMILVCAEDTDTSIIKDPRKQPWQLVLEEKLLADLEQMLILKGQFKMTDEVLDMRWNWYYKSRVTPRFVDKNLAGYNERRPTHLMKLCCIFSASRGDDLTVIPDDFHKAVELLEETEEKMPLVFSGYGKSQYAEVTEEIMQYIGRMQKVSFSTLLRQFIRDVSKEELSKIMQALVEINFCKVTYSERDTYYTMNME